MSSFDSRPFLANTASQPKLRYYRLEESLNGGEFHRRSIDIGIPVNRLVPTLDNWLTARADHWEAKGFTLLRSSTSTQFKLVRLRDRAQVIVRLVEVEK